MKKILLVLLMSSPAFAAKQDVTLHYVFKGQHLEVPVRAPSFAEAIEPGADQCWKFFSKTAANRDEKVSLVDVCANPRLK
jgi:hypothetical protein